MRVAAFLYVTTTHQLHPPSLRIVPDAAAVFYGEDFFSSAAYSAVNRPRDTNVRRDFEAAVVSDMFPGQDWHTFNRAYGPRNGQRRRQFREEFSSIMANVAEHLSPPGELWTRDNIAQLDANIGLPIPLFESNDQRTGFVFRGCYRITRWEFCSGGGDKVRAFVSDLRHKVQEQHRLHSRWSDVLPSCPPAVLGVMREIMTWDSMLLRDWARVELEKAMDPILSGDPKHRYVLRYARIIVNRRTARDETK